MKYSKTVLIGIILMILGVVQNGKAQTIELLAGNTLNGAMNGVLLGGATMALQNSNDFDPVRIGVGLGTLYGVSVGIYDISTVSIGNQFYISGTFNDGTNSTILVLLDTFYGAAAGAVISSSVSLITDKPVVDGLQYGSAAGAFVGFGFGLMDAFMFARRHHTGLSVAASNDRTSGVVRYSNDNKRISMGLINPSISSHLKITGDYIGMHHTLGIDILNLNIKI